MKTRKISLKTWCAVFSALLISFGLAWACYDIDLDQSSNFTPEAMMTDAADFKPLFYDVDYPFYNGFDGGHTSRFNDQVTDDWYNHFDGKIPREKISAFLLEGKDEPAIARSSDPRVKAFDRFVRLARRVDEYACTQLDPWESYNKSAAPLPAGLADEVVKRYDAEKDAFMKNRYAFQALKALFYAGSLAPFERFFTRVEKDMPRNALYYRALSYRAGLARNAHEFRRANLLYAEVFHNLPAMRPVAAYSFALGDEADWRECLRQASPELRPALWALIGFRSGDDVRAIREIYALDPRSSYLDLFLTRIINKKEEHRYDLIGPETRAIYEEHVNRNPLTAETAALIKRIATEEKTANHYLWYAGAAYINTLEGNTSAASALYDKAARALPAGNRMAADQLRLLRLVNSLNAIKAVKGDNVERLTDELVWLYKHNAHQDYADGGVRFKTAIEQSRAYLADLYLRAGNTMYAEMLHHNSSNYTSPGAFDKLIATLEKPRNAFERMLTSIYIYKVEDLYHFKAMQALFADRLGEAESLMKKAGEYGTRDLIVNPFNAYIPDWESRGKAKTGYTALSLIKKMQEGEAKIKRGEDVYNTALLLGNAFYNVTYYGTARRFWRSQLIGASRPEIIPCYARRMMLDCSIAKKYYRMAFNAANTDEERAKAVFFSIRCDRNAFYLAGFRGIASCGVELEGGGGAGFAYEANAGWIDSKGFNELTRYAHTQYYKDVIRECEYFRRYTLIHKNK